jgi:hypothetical protein
MEKRLTKIEVLQEKMVKNLELLAEGHDNILETIERKDEEIRYEFNEKFIEIEAAIMNLSSDIRFMEKKGYENEKELFKLKENLRLAR